MRAERVRQPRVDAGVMERVARLVHERLVVGEAALRARDQVDDLRRVGRDHARARVLLRPVLEVEADVRDRRQVEAERPNASRGRPRPSAPSCTSTRAATDAADSARARSSARSSRSGPEQPLEPALAQPRRTPSSSSSSRRRARRSSSRSEIAFSSSLRAIGSGSPDSSASRSLDGAMSSPRRSSLKRADSARSSSPSSSRSAYVEHGEPRLRRAQRQLLALRT